MARASPTRAEGMATTFEYIEVFYNRRRLHSSLGYTSPVQFLQDRLNTQHVQEQVA